MAKRDEREVKSRLIVLLQHLLKAQFQPERMSVSWNDTVDEQQDQLRELCASLSLERYAVSVFRAAYTSARKRAARETGLPLATFPEKPLWTLRDALGVDLFGALDR